MASWGHQEHLEPWLVERWSRGPKHLAGDVTDTPESDVVIALERKRITRGDRELLAVNAEAECAGHHGATLCGAAREIGFLARTAVGFYDHAHHLDRPAGVGR